MPLVKNLSHHGELRSELYFGPLRMSAIALTRRLDVPRTRIERRVRGETAVTSDTAMRLARFFDTTPEFRLKLQRAYDLARAREMIDVSELVAREYPSSD